MTEIVTTTKSIEVIMYATITTSAMVNMFFFDNEELEFQLVMMRIAFDIAPMALNSQLTQYAYGIK